MTAQPNLPRAGGVIARETDSQADARYLRELLAVIEAMQEPLNDAVRKRPSVSSSSIEKRIECERSFDRLCDAIAGVLGHADAIRLFLQHRRRILQ